MPWPVSVIEIWSGPRAREVGERPPGALPPSGIACHRVETRFQIAWRSR